jgi:hypothetical protein
MSDGADFFKNSLSSLNGDDSNNNFISDIGGNHHFGGVGGANFGNLT